jgi:hypothetical protein
MRGGVAQPLSLVPGRGQDLVAPNDNRTDGDVAPFEAAPSLIQSQRHEPLIGGVSPHEIGTGLQAEACVFDGGRLPSSTLGLPQAAR